MEFTLILCICAMAAGAINSTKASVEDLMVELGTNIANHGTIHEDEDGNIYTSMTLPEIKDIGDVWGITPTPSDIGKFGAIEYNATSIEKPADKTVGIGGKFTPVAQFLASTGSTYDLTIYYDTSYDPDGGSSAWLDRYWLVQRVETAPSEISCGQNPLCQGTSGSNVFENGDITNTYHPNQFSLSKTQNLGGTIITDPESQFYGYCHGVASECIPKNYANGTYRITLVVQDLDGNTSSPKSIEFEIETKHDYYGYIEEVVDTYNEIYNQENDESQKYVALVDHDFGLIEDLYGVEHVVIRKNMLRTSVPSTWSIKTTSEICKYLVLYDGKTGEEISRETEPVSCWTQTVTTDDFESSGDAGFDTENTDEDEKGNLWESAYLENNSWKFYIYDKRSLYYKGLLPATQHKTDAISPILSASTDSDTKYNSITNNTGADIGGDFKGVWKVSGAKSEITDANGNKYSAITGNRNLCTTADLGGSNYTPVANPKGCAEGQVYMYDYQDHPSDNLDVINKAKISAYVKGVGLNNEGPNPNTSSEAQTNGKDMNLHVSSPNWISDIYLRTCVGSACTSTTRWKSHVSHGTLEDDVVLQVESNYKYYRYKDYDANNPDPKLLNIKKEYKTDTDEAWDLPYRNDVPDFNDGSEMYQLRQNAKKTNKYLGTGNGQENNLDPEFISVRLSLADGKNYNPGFDAYTNQPYDGSGRGCAECTEPNYNEDVKIQWTEVREITVKGQAANGQHVDEVSCSVSDGGTCNFTFNHHWSDQTFKRNARTRQMNIVEHLAFDWVYEYSGSGNNVNTYNTYKIKRAHWHTMGRTAQTIKSGLPDDPYTLATDSNGGGARQTASNNPKRLFTDTDKSNLPANNTVDGISNPEYWKILRGTISHTISSGTTQSHTHYKTCSRTRTCSCGGGGTCTKTLRRTHTWSPYVTINVTWVGFQEVYDKTDNEANNGANSSNSDSYWTESYTVRKSDTGWDSCCSPPSCSKCPPKTSK